MTTGDSQQAVTVLDLASLFFFRPVLAVAFVLSLIVLSWYIAWKTVLVHVPLVQEVFGLRRKQHRPKPANTHRFSRFYNSATPVGAASRGSAVGSSTDRVPKKA